MGTFKLSVIIKYFLINIKLSKVLTDLLLEFQRDNMKSYAFFKRIISIIIKLLQLILKLEYSILLHFLHLVQSNLIIILL